MRIKISFLIATILMSIVNIHAQDVTTVEATDSDISDNLDLEAVASVFGEAKDLEDFEKRLNDPDSQISNLDLNEDGEVDYLRVVEVTKDETHVVTVQAVLGDDQFQDVATIDVEKDSNGETQVQVVGDVYMYGPNYIVEPVYVHPPVVIVWFWGPYYNPWRSPYYWGYYPPYYRPWRPYPPHRYRTNVRVNINVNHTYRHTTVRRSKTSVNIQKSSRRNDYGKKNPNKSFSSRNKGVSNRSEMVSNRSTKPTSKAPATQNKKSTGKKVQKDWKPASAKEGRDSKVKNNKVTVPANKPSSSPNAKPANKPSSKPATKPASRPTTQPKVAPKPAARPATTPAATPKPAARPAARPTKR